MTALAGFWAFGDAAEPLAACGRMLKAQQVYAPEAPVARRDDEVALGRRLHRTLPEDRFDRGPVSGGDGRWTLVADVRLDNRDELGEALGLGAAEAASMADSTLVMKCIERWEDAAFGRLIGDFALAVWDRARTRFLLARDFLGHRPLHFHRAPGFFAFASMPKGLHALAEIPREPDTRAVSEFLALLPETGRRSFFRDIERVLPGEVLTVTRRGEEARRLWTFDREPLRLSRAEDYAEAVRASFDEAVRARLRGADGRVAAHLSGGLDSSAVTATAARQLLPEGRVTAYTAVPREGYEAKVPIGRFADEGPHAAAVAALYPNVEHVLVRASGQSPVANLDRNFFAYERPVLNLCNAVWSDAILEDARARGLKVLLTGQMGNMSFSYTGLEQLSALLARGRFVRLARESLLLRRRGTRLLSVVAHAIGPFLPQPLWRGANRLAGRRLDIADYSAIRPERAAELEREAAARGLDFGYRPRRDSVATRLWVLSRVDLGNYQKGALGTWGVDVRDPTADRRLIDLCLAIPPEQYLANGYTRALARRAFADRLPDAVLGETRKGLQAADWHEGLAAGRAEAEEQAGRIGALPAAADILDTEKMAGLLEAWPEGDWNAPGVQAPYRLALLRGLSGGHFIRKASGAN
ncbi:MAG TPA: asparagine synthase-related protein [Allosphingosinicella sp.]